MKKYLIITAFLGAITILLGAFGAHSLKATISLELLTSFETAVRYQMYHVLLLLLINSAFSFDEKSLTILNLIFLSGIVLFSGSIYAIVFGVPSSSIWFITPLGGLTLILGWVYLALVIWRNNVKN